MAAETRAEPVGVPARRSQSRPDREPVGRASRRRLTSLAVVVAVLAASILWLWFRLPLCLRYDFRTAATRPRLVRLHGFPPPPVESATRGGESNLDTRLLAAVRSVQREAQLDPSPATLHTLGIANLLIGRIPEAVGALRRAGVGHTDSAVDNDLGAALVQQGIQDRKPRLVAEGLEVLMDIGVRSAEARFNEAIALEAIGLSSQALAAWEDYQRIDGESGWDKEVYARMERLRSGAKESPSSEADEREVLEVLLPRWADAVRAHRHADAEQLLRQASQRALEHESETRDRLLVDSVYTVYRAKAHRQAALLRGHLSYALARDAYSKQDLKSCQHRAPEAADLLAAAGSPAASLARVTEASCDFLANRLDLARRHAEEAIELAAAHTPPSALAVGQALWLQGLVAHAQNRPLDALQAYRQALLKFEHARDPQRQAAMHALLSGLYDYLGQNDEAWMEAVHAIRPLEQAPRRRYQALWGLADLARRERFPRVARRVAGSLQADAQLIGLGDYLVDALLVQGRTEREAGESQAATKSFERAVTAAAGIGDLDSRRRVTAHAAVELARSVVGEDPKRAAELVRAAEPFERTDGELYLAAAQVRALALVQAGESAAAETALRTAVQRSTAERANFSLLGDRDALMARRTELHHLLVRVLADRGRWVEALDVIEGWRTEPFTRTLSANRHGPQPALAVDDDTVLFAFLCLDDKLLVWRIDAAGIALTRHAVGRDAVAELAAASGEEVRQGGGVGPESASARLIGLLFGDAALPPVRRLVLVPDEALYAVPFAALHGVDGRALVERHQITVSPSARLWASLDATSARRPHCAWLIAGSPGGGALYPRLPTLARIADELRAVAARYACSTLADTAEGIRSSRRGGFDVIHYAGHSIPGGDSGGALLMPSAADEVVPIPSTELEHWSLEGAVVVLSSCAAAEGRRSWLAGRDGLARAFLSGGARSVIANLWPVQDEHAFELAVALHRELSGGSEPAAALRAAQLELIGNGRPAAAWAGWVASGAG